MRLSPFDERGRRRRTESHYGDAVVGHLYRVQLVFSSYFKNSNPRNCKVTGFIFVIIANLILLLFETHIMYIYYSV